MNTSLRAKLKAWPERYRATMAMFEATQDGDLATTKRLLSEFPLLDEYVPYNARCWSQLAAAAGQLQLMNFWRKREKKTRPSRKQVSPELLLFWAMNDEWFPSIKGDSVKVAKRLMDEGADVEGDLKGYSPLHRAVFRNRPELVELLIRRGANLSRRYLTGESALQIAQRAQADECVALLERAGAPLVLPKKPERPKPIRTVDLRASAEKLRARIEAAVRQFILRHRRELVTAIALASIPHEGYVMISFDTHVFAGSPWDCTFSEFAWAIFPDWRRAHQGDVMRLVDLEAESEKTNRTRW